jgi:hypothetical protein
MKLIYKNPKNLKTINSKYNTFKIISLHEHFDEDVNLTPEELIQWHILCYKSSRFNTISELSEYIGQSLLADIGVSCNVFSPTSYSKYAHDVPDLEMSQYIGILNTLHFLTDNYTINIHKDRELLNEMIPDFIKMVMDDHSEEWKNVSKPNYIQFSSYEYVSGFISVPFINRIVPNIYNHGVDGLNLAISNNKKPYVVSNNNKIHTNTITLENIYCYNSDDTKEDPYWSCPYEEIDLKNFIFKDIVCPDTIISLDSQDNLVDDYAYVIFYSKNPEMSLLSEVKDILEKSTWKFYQN